MTGRDEAVAAGEALGWDVVLKATAEHLRERPDQAHVWRNIDDAAEMADAWDTLGTLIAEPERAGFVVQKNARPGVPVAIRSIEDPLFGPVVSFGIAGPLTELLADRAYRIPPLGARDAASMVREIKSAPMLFGYRGSEAVDVAEVERLIQRVSQLQNDVPQVSALELSLVLAGADGATVLTASARVDPVARPALGLVRAPAVAAGRGHPAVLTCGRRVCRSAGRHQRHLGLGGSRRMDGQRREDHAREPAQGRPEGRPSTYVSALLTTDDGFAALGGGASSPVAWSSTDFAAWEPTGLAGRTPAIGSVTVNGAGVLADGSLLAVGSRSRSLGSDAAAWVEARRGLDAARGAGVRQPRRERLRQPVGPGHGGRQGRGGAGRDRLRQRRERGAPALRARRTGSAGRRVAARGARPRPRTTSTSGVRPTWTSASPSNGSISMSAAAAVGGGFLIGGSRGPAGTGEQRGTLWSSADGRTWAPRPGPAEAAGAATRPAIDALRGRRAAGRGHRLRRADSARGPGLRHGSSWVSERPGPLLEGRARSSAPDGGQRRRRPGGAGRITSPLGSVGPSGDRRRRPRGRRPTVRTWSPHRARAASAARGQATSTCPTAVVDGDQLRLVGGDVPPAGGGYYCRLGARSTRDRLHACAAPGPPRVATVPVELRDAIDRTGYYPESWPRASRARSPARRSSPSSCTTSRPSTGTRSAGTCRWRC